MTNFSLFYQKEQPFTDEEKEQLESVLDFNATELNVVLDSCQFIFEQAAYYTLPPNRLANQLHEAGLDQEHVCIIY